MVNDDRGKNNSQSNFTKGSKIDFNQIRVTILFMYTVF